MDILFKQDLKSMPVCEELGVEGCMLKLISSKNDKTNITRQRHYHSGVEIHIVTEGEQEYEVDSERVTVRAGEFLMIMPRVYHIALGESHATLKYAIVFNFSDGSDVAELLGRAGDFICGAISDEISFDIEQIHAEREGKRAYCGAVMGTRLDACLLSFLRMIGLREKRERGAAERGEDGRVSLVKQYIDDNICRSISLSELASYCYLSERQLSRIFLSSEGISVSEHIRRKKCKRIEELLANTGMTLREISESMGFDNEYYFNAFYKKYAGMSPGAYRRSLTK